ncbi:Zinc transporter [Thalictrum thalictroides]|uniref:Zinc transporter n=1 Tax=Thalictrum thalictroides TaxID=46969 RepID=A0A7J6VVE5_THATH|nr:Zinc transporter [Thalictrum thalictroides]
METHVVAMVIILMTMRIIYMIVLIMITMSTTIMKKWTPELQAIAFLTNPSAMMIIKTIHTNMIAMIMSTNVNNTIIIIVLITTVMITSALQVVCRLNLMEATHMASILAVTVVVIKIIPAPLTSMLINWISISIPHSRTVVSADTMGSVSVIITTLLIKYKGWLIADPVCSIFISVMIISSVISLLRSSAEIFLQRVSRAPELELKQALDDILRIRGVHNIRNVHIWSFINIDVVGTLQLHVSSSADKDSTKAQVSQLLFDSWINDLTVDKVY